MAVYTTDFGMLCDGSLQGWLSVAKFSQMRKDKRSGNHQKAQISCHGKHSATDVKLPRLINDLMVNKDRQNKYQKRQQDRKFLVILFGTHTTGRDT